MSDDHTSNSPTSNRDRQFDEILTEPMHAIDAGGTAARFARLEHGLKRRTFGRAAMKFRILTFRELNRRSIATAVIASFFSPLFRALLVVNVLWFSPIAAPTLRADTWAAPSVFEAKSETGEIIARIEPAWPRIPRGAKTKAAAKVTVFRVKGETLEQLWKCDLSNRVSPVSALVSNDGLYVVTFDNWHRVGYGDDVIAFYSRQGLIKKYSLEAAVPAIQDLSPIEMLQLMTASSRWWRGHNVKLIPGNGNAAQLRMWVDWAEQWYAWRMEDGMPVAAEDSSRTSASDPPASEHTEDNHMLTCRKKRPNAIRKRRPSARDAGRCAVGVWKRASQPLQMGTSRESVKSRKTFD